MPKIKNHKIMKEYDVPFKVDEVEVRFCLDCCPHKDKPCKGWCKELLEHKREKRKGERR